MEEGGTRTFTFKRALDTGDAAQDAVLGGDTAHAVMWAYHATSDDISDYHSANKGTVSSDELDFFSTGIGVAFAPLFFIFFVSKSSSPLP